MKISKYVYSEKNKMKNLAVHRDDCVTCLLFKQMYITDTVVDRLLFSFCKSSLKTLFIAIMKKTMPLEGDVRRGRIKKICVEYLKNCIIFKSKLLNVKGCQLPKYSDTC